MSAPRLPIVAVLGSGTTAHDARAAEVGAWLAGQGVHLLTGGGGGVMAAASRAFFQAPSRRGLVIGVLPAAALDDARPKPGYPNPWIEIPIATHLPYSGQRGTDPLSRNHINLLSADVAVFLPGGAGTASEARLAVQYQRPGVAYLASRAEIPDLPPGFPVVASLAELQIFVREVLGRVTSARG
ncbi:MAG TPA: molybdenum cofactor carrier protein [Polyangia bacterium]|nr:molybdenum cofactor carrier protein [Polyangia bacterium]